MDNITTHTYNGFIWGGLFLCVSAILLFNLIRKKERFGNVVSVGACALCVLKGIAKIYIALCYCGITADEWIEAIKRISRISECIDMLTVIAIIVLLSVLLFRLKKSA